MNQGLNWQIGLNQTHIILKKTSDYLPLGFGILLDLGAQPLVGPGDVEDVCDREPRDEAAQVDERVTLDPPHGQRRVLRAFETEEKMENLSFETNRVPVHPSVFHS